MNNKILFAALIILAFIGTAILFRQSSSTQNQLYPEVILPVTGSLSPSTPQPIEQNFSVRASNFSFEPKEIRIKLGDRVNIQLTNREGTHDFVIDEYNVKSQQLSAGQNGTVSFTADRIGEFEYYCSVGQHRSLGMAGKLIVE